MDVHGMARAKTPIGSGWDSGEGDREKERESHGVVPPGGVNVSGQGMFVGVAQKALFPLGVA